jgi:hypothetical protein
LALATAGLVWCAGLAPASAQVLPRPDLRLCPPTGECRLFPKRMVIQANALGRTPSIVASNRGLLWPSASGYVTLAVPRPIDYRGGAVRVGVFHYVNGGGEGTVGMRMTPVGLRPGGGYETYGDGVTPLVPANYDTHYEQWLVLPTESTGFSGSDLWWHVKIGRYGTYDDRLHLLTVLVEYY